MTTFLQGRRGQSQGFVCPNFTCRPIYEEHGGATAHRCTYILGNLTGTLSDVCLSWIGNGSNLAAWDEWAWLDRMSSLYASGALGRDSLPSRLLLHSLTSDPSPVSLAGGRVRMVAGRRRPAGNGAKCVSVSGRLSGSQPVVEFYDACRPFAQQAVPDSTHNCQVYDQTSMAAPFLPSSHPRIVI